MRSSVEVVDGPKKNAVQIFFDSLSIDNPFRTQRMHLRLETFSPGTWKTYQDVGGL